MNSLLQTSMSNKDSVQACTQRTVYKRKAFELAEIR